MRLTWRSNSLDLHMPESLMLQVALGFAHSHRLLNYSLAAFRPKFRSRNARSGGNHLEDAEAVGIHLETMKGGQHLMLLTTSSSSAAYNIWICLRTALLGTRKHKLPSALYPCSNVYVTAWL